jgi:hypothetical protein
MTTNDNSNKSPWRFVMPLMLVLAVLLLIFGFLKSPLSPLHMCTLMGCFDSLEIILFGEPPQDYTLQVTSNTGETRRATCTLGEDKYSDTYPATTICRNTSVTFYDFSPSQVTIEITWQGGSFSTSGHPSYESVRPNGRFCDPVCQVGKLLVNTP